MKTMNVEYAIIGAGTSGLGAYSRIRRKTDSVVMIQDGPLRHHLRAGRLHAEQTADHRRRLRACPGY